MRHHDNKRKFGRETDQRRAFMKSLANNLISKEKITTTLARAKELRPFIEKLVTMARKNTLSSQRTVSARLGVEKTTHKLIKEIAPKYKDRLGGYTRITKVAPRMGDGSKMAIIEFV